MMLVLYYEPWVAVSGAISSEQLWKDVFMWSYDETVDDAIEGIYIVFLFPIA